MDGRQVTGGGDSVNSQLANSFFSFYLFVLLIDHARGEDVEILS